MAMIVPRLPSSSSRRSGCLIDADQLPLQNWLATQQQASMANRRLAAKSLSSLKDIPCTHQEWKKTLAQIKSDYSNRRYRHCSSRCIEILKNSHVKDNAQPAYLIYLHFYAATSLETQARNLHTASPYRLKLLEEAREYYNLASQQTEAAQQQSTHLTTWPMSPSSTIPSPVDSCLSHHSLSTRMSSPTPSTASSFSSSTTTTTKRKKKVAFADQVQSTYTPRPDSPTLGFSDLDSPALPPPCQDSFFEPLPPSVQTRPDLRPAFSPSPTLDGDGFRHPAHEEQQYPDSREYFERCNAVLASIQRQITSHVAVIDRDITAALASKPALPVSDEMRSLELRSRIERLRANGWQRKRFDAKRYQEFRDEVMADMLA